MKLFRSLRTKVVLLLVGVSILATALALLAARRNTEQAIWDQVAADGELVGAIIAEAIAMSRELPDQFEKDRETDLLSTARILAEYVALAQRSRLPREKVQEVLEELAQDLGLAEVWITDDAGRAVYSVPRDVPFTFSPDPKLQPQASAFWPLLKGEVKTISQPVSPRDLDGELFKYVGVAGVDQPRIVQLGARQDTILALRNRLSLSRLSDSLMRQGVLSKPLLVLDGQLQPIDEEGHGLRAGESPPKGSLALQPAQMQAVEEALATDLVVKRMEPDAAMIYRAYRTADGRHQGVFAAGFSRRGLDELLERQNRAAIEVALLAILVSTVLGSMASLRLTKRLGRVTAVARGIRRGNFSQLEDLQGESQRRDEIGILSQVMHTMGQEVRNREAELEARVQRRTQELAERNEALAAAQALISRELDLAKRLQLGILPAAFPARPGWQGAARIQMQQQMGGDFFDFIERPDGSVALVMADVSGKGIAAAFFMAMARTSLLHHLSAGLGPAQSLAEANQELCRANPLDLFVTVFVAVLDPLSGRIEHANAGHNPPLMRRADGSVHELPSPGDVALGVWPGYGYATSQTQLGPGERLLAYTDGVTETFDLQGQAYGVPQLVSWFASVESSADVQALVDGLFDEVIQFQGAAAQADDITVAVIHREDLPIVR